VEAVDLEAREVELCANDGGVLPNLGCWPLARGFWGGAGEAMRQGYAASKPRMVG
jgi:hypothetical protein